MLGVVSACWVSACNYRELTVSVVNREYVPPPAPRALPAAPAPIVEPEPPPMEVVREAPIAPPPPPPAPAPEARVLGDIYFDFDRAAIRSEGKTLLEEATGILRNESGRTLVIEGHCDERGTDEYNLVLGERRAQAVRDYLVGRGMDASRLHATSYGKERPACLEHAERCWKQNRRAHLVLE